MKTFNRLIWSALMFLSSLCLVTGMARGQSVPFAIAIYYPTNSQSPAQKQEGQQQQGDAEEQPAQPAGRRRGFPPRVRLRALTQYRHKVRMGETTSLSLPGLSPTLSSGPVWIISHGHDSRAALPRQSNR